MNETNTLYKLWRSFFIYTSGVFLTHAAFTSILGLQSSVNIIEGLGTITTSVLYISGVLSTILFIPVLLRKFGPKRCICGSEVTYMFYYLANFYPSFYTMIPAAVLVGIGDSMLWSATSILNAFFASQYTSVTGEMREGGHQARFSGYFVCIFQTAKIPGNLISYAVLYGYGNQIEKSFNFTSNATNHAWNNSIERRTYSHCGANDCQDSNAVNEAIQQYAPSNNLALYILLAIMCLFSVAAVTIHILFIPGKASSFGTSEGTTQNDRRKLQEHHSSTEENSQEKVYVSFAFGGMRAIFAQIFTLKQMLLVPVFLYTGFQFGFITSELSRAYTSCIFGVSWVPIHMMCYGISAGVFSYITGKLSKKVPRAGFILLATISDFGACIFCLLWTPNLSSHFPVLVMYALMGGMRGVWITITQATQINAFPERLDVGMPVWTFWMTLGSVVAFAWSTSLCVSSKIYVQMILLGISVVGYVTVERMGVHHGGRSI